MLAETELQFRMSNTNKPLRVLHVEDSERDATLLARYLKRSGYNLVSERVETAESMKAALTASAWDIILCDYAMPNFNALAALEVLKQADLDLPFIIISGTIGEAVAVEAMRAGAHDYLMKDNLTRLSAAIERGVHEAENRRARRRAEEALRTSELELRTLFEAMTDTIIVYNRAGRHLKIAPTKSASLYRHVDERIGKTVHQVFPPEQADLFLERINRALDEGQMQRVEYSLPINGQEKWFEGSISPLTEHSVLWIARDITESKQVEDERARLVIEIEKHRQRLDNIVSSVPGVVWESWGAPDAQRVDFVSDYIETMLGYTVEEWLSTPNFWLTIIHPDDYGQAVRSGAEAFADARPATQQFRWIRKNGETVWVESNYVVVKDEEGRPAGLRGVTIDIDERKTAEEALRQSEERYRDLVENAHDIIYSHDLDGNYTSINKAGEQISGYTREEALTLNLSQLVAPEYLKKAREMINRKVAGESVTAYELEILSKDDRRITVEVNTKLVYQDGVPVGVQGIARDITQRIQLEQQFRQSQKMEAIGQLAGGVAHDFNNLLTAINGYSSLALRRMSEGSPIAGYLEEIRKAGDRAANLTRQLLAFGRKQMLQPVALNLNDVVDDMNKMLQRLIGEDVTLTAKFDPQLRKIKADPGQIEQVLVNLVVNARDAMPRGGTLTIETSNFEVDGEFGSEHIGVNPGNYVMLAVSDTGTGMNDQTKAKIFEPFFTTKEKGKGTGLGLSTVYGIVKQSGGHVWVYSELGRGTTFKVYLPQMEPRTAPANEKPQVESAAPIGSETILLVEDEDVVRGLAREILEEAGYKVLDASGGEEAFRLCQDHAESIDLLLTDVVMPGMSGKEIADHLKSIRPTTGVLFMSGYTDEAIVHHGVLDSDVEFIQKPFTPTALARRVREVLDLRVDHNGEA